ncbi:MAG: coiled coil domain-containing protein [Desulfobacterales bacterium]|nr:coiled coil domain-containing protein [Desulfobacterales bacterium]
MKDKRKVFEEKLDADFKECSVQIALLKAKAELQDLKTASDETWEAIKTGSEKAWAEIKIAYNDAASSY